MATRGERAFAWVGIAVALLSVCALSGAVIAQELMSKNTDNASGQQTTLACSDNNTEQKYPAPEAYTVSSPVKALQVTDITKGSGPAAKAGDCLIAKYYGTLASSGLMFDENYTTTTAFAFTLGQGQVIQGWDQGLVGMQAGGERRLVIPASLGYGAQSSGQIPANSDLVFYVRLLRIQ